MNRTSAFESMTVALALTVTTFLGCSSDESPPDGNSDTPSSGGAGVDTGGTASGGASNGLGGSTSATGGSSNASGGTSNEGGSAGDNASGGSGDMNEPGPFALSSPSWDAVDNDDCTPDAPVSCPLYPQENTNYGEADARNISPEMSWSPGPEGTESYAMVLQDLSNGFVHWVIWNIPATTQQLPAGLPAGTLTDPAGAQQAGFGTPPGYFGSGACGNVYEHRLYALGVPSLNPGMTPNARDGARAAILDSDAILAETFVRLQSRDYCD